jgi:hypothetical protein
LEGVPTTAGAVGVATGAGVCTGAGEPGAADPLGGVGATPWVEAEADALGEGETAAEAETVAPAGAPGCVADLVGPQAATVPTASVNPASATIPRRRWAPNRAAAVLSFMVLRPPEFQRPAIGSGAARL